MMENRLSESRERRIRVPVRGKGITSLEGHAQGFRHVLYEGGKPWERRNLSTTMGHSTGLIREQCPVW